MSRIPRIVHTGRRYHHPSTQGKTIMELIEAGPLAEAEDRLPVAFGEGSPTVPPAGSTPR
jgi:hypothetical protein